MSFGAGTSHNPNNDVEVQNAATDGISCLDWAPNANFLVAGSWDNQATLATDTTPPRPPRPLCPSLASAY